MILNSIAQSKTAFVLTLHLAGDSNLDVKLCPATTCIWLANPRLACFKHGKGFFSRNFNRSPLCWQLQYLAHSVDRIPSEYHPPGLQQEPVLLSIPVPRTACIPYRSAVQG
ncbi:hypothetical protein AVEN_155104-1 [Araneus ventricosus]|uniref:Uncharacterized protein n=1 Tax=Araneus ventricosus TaxID=182803 RepID=A0A4Y2A8W2_ARAVE|nr:hypothetical protein AVEN_155104-1 [Araneus ventricosus]